MGTRPLRKLIAVGATALVSTACGEMVTTAGEEASDAGGVPDARADVREGRDAQRGRDAASREASTRDGGTDARGGPCNAVAELGAPVAVVYSDAPLPEPLGGDLTDGTYVLTAMIDYGLAPHGAGPDLSTTFVLTGGILQAVTETGSTTLRETSVVSTSETTITLSPTCFAPSKPEEVATEGTFTSQGGDVHFFFGASGGAGTVETVYARK